MNDPRAQDRPDPAEPRLERALLAYLQWRDRAPGGSSADLVQAHPDLADLLTPMLEPASAPPAPDPDARTLGDYRLVREIGRGGMGVVYEATQLSLDRTVALKVLPAHLTLEATAVARFLRESTLAARLEHPGIVSVHGVGSNDGAHWFAMDFLEAAPLDAVLEEVRAHGAHRRDGATLAAAVRARQHLAGRRAAGGGAADALALADRRIWGRPYVTVVVDFAAQTAEALSAAHRSGIVHRDVKPSNILVRCDGRVVLTDFGLARCADQPALTATGQAPGTPHYTSPEQAAGRAVDARADVFSLGATLYELLTLRAPFAGASTHEILAKVQGVDPEDPRRHCPELAPDLCAILAKAMEKEPARRYADAGAFAADLRAFLDGRPVEARPLSLQTRLWRWVRRNPWIASLAAGLVIALVLVLQQNLRLRDTIADLRRMSDVQAVRDLRGSLDHLPAWRPEHAPALERWLAEAKDLIGRRHLHQARLEVLRARALPYTVADRERDRSPPAYVQELPRWQRQQLDVAFGAKAGTAQRWTWRFTDPADQWEHDTLAELVVRILDFAGPEYGPHSMATARLAHLRSVEERTLVAARDAWRSAIADIADPRASLAYGGLRLEPQLGLVPIGKDPDSGLWEFAHVQSGTPMQRDAAGRAIPSAAMGIVFVLLPGGRVTMGARPPDGEHARLTPHVDPLARPVEGPVHELELAPFFLAKFEVTQGQWLRLTGTRPSQNPADQTDEDAVLRHPVDTVSAYRCEEVLGLCGLALPSEAQWEYACRAGTTTPWTSGSEPISLNGSGNLADRHMMLARGIPESQAPDAFARDDGYAYSSPVGLFPANRFGLHDMIGNLAEFTGCVPARYSVAAAPLTGARRPDSARHLLFRMVRGASYINGFLEARSAFRDQVHVHTATAERGVRPARAIDP